MSRSAVALFVSLCEIFYLAIISIANASEDAGFGVGSGHSPAFPTFVIPAKAGIQGMRRLPPRWIPAFAGMTRF
ncbi:hypothetical protein C3E99_05270 [Sphingopyxis sp. MG]|nr:hypothetical protein C3E99_05270 [Sphingopyxis sp. MG]